MTRANGIADSALLNFLVRAGLLTSQVAEAAEAGLAKPDGKSAIDWLARKGIMNEEALARALAERLRLPMAARQL